MGGPQELQILVLGVPFYGYSYYFFGGVPYYDYSIIYPETLFFFVTPQHWGFSASGLGGLRLWGFKAERQKVNCLVLKLQNQEMMVLVCGLSV